VRVLVLVLVLGSTDYIPWWLRLKLLPSLPRDQAKHAYLHILMLLHLKVKTPCLAWDSSIRLLFQNMFRARKPKAGARISTTPTRREYLQQNKIICVHEFLLAKLVGTLCSFRAGCAPPEVGGT
jgi:hypothetical protein